MTDAEIMGPARRYIVRQCEGSPLYSVEFTEAKPGQSAFWTFEAAANFCAARNQPIIDGLTGAPV